MRALMDPTRQKNLKYLDRGYSVKINALKTFRTISLEDMLILALRNINFGL